jgi:prephenate dehydrogenase
MWKDILLSNKGNILELLARLRNRLETLEELIETGDEQGITEFFSKARAYREGLK